MPLILGETMPKSIAYKITLYTGILCLLTLCSFGIFSYIQTKHITSTLTLDLQKQQLQTTQSLIASKIINFKQQLKQFSKNINPLNPTLIQAQLTSFFNATNLTSLYIGFDKDQKLLSINTLNQKPLYQTSSNLKNQQWYQFASQEIYTSQAHYDNTLKQIIITLSTPLYLNDKLIGVLGADFPLQSISQLLKDTPLPSSSYYFIIDGQNTIIAHPNDKILLQQHPSIDKFIALYKQAKDNLSLKNTNQTITCSNFVELNWLLCSSVQKDSLFDSSLFLSQQIIIALIILFITFAILIALNKKLLSPLKNIQKALYNLFNSNPTPISLTSKDEFGEIARLINIQIKTVQEQTLVNQTLLFEAQNVIEQYCSFDFTQSLDEALFSHQDYKILAQGIHSLKTLLLQTLQTSLQQNKALHHKSSILKLSLNTLLNTSSKNLDLSQNILDSLSTLNSNNTTLNSQAQQLIQSTTKLKELLDHLHYLIEQTTLLPINHTIKAIQSKDNQTNLAELIHKIKQLSSQLQNLSNKIQIDSKSLSTLSSVVQQNANEQTTQLTHLNQLFQENTQSNQQNTHSIQKTHQTAKDLTEMLEQILKDLRKKKW